MFFVDSAQRGDGKRMNMEKEIDQALENFPVFSHEPYYRAYSELDLKNLFKEVGGLDCEAEELAWVSKTLVFQKPGGDESSAMNGASVTELRDDDDVNDFFDNERGYGTQDNSKSYLRIENYVGTFLLCAFVLHFSDFHVAKMFSNA